MNKLFRRFEILLPLQFNDGRPVPAKLNLVTLRELRERFGAISVETQKIQGEWSNAGKVYRDELVRLFIDLPDTPAVRAFFQQYKRILKRRYRQLEIWVTSYPVEVI